MGETVDNVDNFVNNLLLLKKNVYKNILTNPIMQTVSIRRYRTPAPAPIPPAKVRPHTGSQP